jgi:hypothetical protein
MTVAAREHLQPAHADIIAPLCFDFVLFEHLANELDMADWTLQRHEGPPWAPQWLLCADILASDASCWIEVVCFFREKLLANDVRGALESDSWRIELRL